MERATNSSSSWIIWTAVAGALTRLRPVAVRAGAVMMLATCGGYYTASTLGDTFGAGGVGTAVVWGATGLAGGPLLGWAGWTVRRGRGDARPLAGAVIAMVVPGEGLWLGLSLHCWGEAAGFLAVGAVSTVLLTVYLARAGVRRYWLCAVLTPVGALLFHLAEVCVLGALL
ncbi:DUF6518 family protein [Actinacidiphila glaucinigra]|uniref:DUF6518 family protein n=1 Tax=Actinacidiphila glaucinigra TaxID=235986 RepID=UPI003250B538